MSQEKRAKVLARLDELQVSYELLEHPAAFTVEDMNQLGISDRGLVCKNLFLRDDKGKKHFLVTAPKDKPVDLDQVRRQLGSSRLGFASAERLDRFLGLVQGEVSPFGLLNDLEAKVEMVFDESLQGQDRLGVHPNDNTATVWISFDELRRVIEANGNRIRLIQI
ncbi:MAG: prolyl-tRNA synthetase associated domain-containing protein [Deltaproteobacteria bacterium]|jgi:Ala-tRNA(Pro) deacylase|nr:prolyl-tRNA synthetase associated domain-containing protein [Deltaproteobacteria bacterium]